MRTFFSVYKTKHSEVCKHAIIRQDFSTFGAITKLEEGKPHEAVGSPSQEMFKQQMSFRDTEVAVLQEVTEWST